MMKLSKLFVIAALVGGVAVIGCGDDEPVNGTGGTGGNGTGGTGGNGTDPCTGANCDDTTADNKAICEGAIETCETETDRTDCDDLAGIICPADLSGAGGAGGDGGAGGGGGDCPTADEACTGGLCESAASKALCTSSYDNCVNSGGSCEDCQDVADFWCGGEPAG